MIRVERQTELEADATRVIARLFLPGEGLSVARSRTTEIAERVMGLAPERVRALARDLLDGLASRHADVSAVFDRNAGVVVSRLEGSRRLSDDQRIVLGATFTAEYAVEGAALCNPSAVPHPDQRDMGPGQLRVAVALRSIGEGHLSSITFAEAVIDGDAWTFVERRKPLAQAGIGEGSWQRDQLRQALENHGHLTELANVTLRLLPESFPVSAVELALSELPAELTSHRDSRRDAEELRAVAASAYSARFDPDSVLSQRVLLPVTAEEDHGMEDARFVCFTQPDGTREYRGTYTAYNGREAMPKLIVSPDLASFAIHPLVGPAVRSKGIALFPRAVGGRHLALNRAEGESISLAGSADGVVWNDLGVVHRPTEPWEIVQTGNCGSPLETEAGWIALMHGVGPMRSYSVGALLLDLDDPSRVIARTAEPILRPSSALQDGYVPNVVYSCGALVHDGTLWIPFGVDDCRVRVFSIRVDELIAGMVAV